MKKILAIIAVMICVCIIPVNVMAAKDDDIIIVIDPGHGGSQNGAEYNGLMEKDINMAVSNALVEELEKYEGIKVYLTHDSAEDEMSIKERAEFADKVNADYLFCIHFNASGNHNFYGAEAWVGSYGRYYSEMYAFSEILLKDFESIGLYNRCIKTKLETDGTDYYGILRRCAEYDIPSVIIEHCHMDNAEDASYLDEDADFIKFGQIDAEAIAKFLGLKSMDGKKDFSNRTIVFPEEPEESLKNDETSPECKLTYLGFDEEKQELKFGISASDDDYPILYYGYSVDDGKTYSALHKWEKDKSYIEFSVNKEICTGDNITAVVFNAYNLPGYSDEVTVGEILRQYEAKIAARDMIKNAVLETVTTAKVQTGGEIYLIIAGVAILVALIVLIVFVKDLNNKD